MQSLFQNSILGVQQGYLEFLELVGVGYKATLINQNTIQFQLGQSHDILFQIPPALKAFSVKPTLLGLYGVDKACLGQIAADIRNLKIPEIYKGKGIRYKDESIKLKVGKKK